MSHHTGHSLNRIAFSATTHCLTGCAIGEVMGMVIGTALGWSNVATIVLAVVLAFIFGYSLTTMHHFPHHLSIKVLVGLVMLHVAAVAMYFIL